MREKEFLVLFVVSPGGPRAGLSVFELVLHVAGRRATKKYSFPTAFPEVGLLLAVAQARGMMPCLLSGLVLVKIRSHSSWLENKRA